MWEDPIVSDVRRAREELSAQFDFDVTAIFADIRVRQAALGPRLVSQRKRTEPADVADWGLRSTSVSSSGTAAPVPGN